MGDKTVVVNVSGGYEEVCREYLDDCIYVCKDGKPTSFESIYNLREEVKRFPKLNKRDRLLHELRSIAIYQFGGNGGKFIPEDVSIKGRYHKKILSDKMQFALLNADTGLYSLTLKGGEILKNLSLKVVEINFDLTTNTLFSPGVEKADNNIIPKDEVVILRDGEVVAVGKAILSGREMEEATKGIAIKIRQRKNNVLK